MRWSNAGCGPQEPGVLIPSQAVARPSASTSNSSPVARHARLQEGWDGSAGDPGEDVAVDLAGLFEVQEMTGTADDDHARGWGEEGLGAAGQVCCDAAVIGPVQVEGGLRCPAAGRLLPGRPVRASPRCGRGARGAGCPVVAERGGQVRGLPQRLLDPGEVLARVIAG